jgi:hypothetical protein
MSPTQAVQDTENEDEWLTGAFRCGDVGMAGRRALAGAWATIQRTGFMVSVQSAPMSVPASRLLELNR